MNECSDARVASEATLNEDFDNSLDFSDGECLELLSKVESDERVSPAQHRVDPEAIKTWLYPVSKEEREYQLSISEEALFSNTLVSLPTGLGKTLIAAVIMLNFARWFPDSITVFSSPTRPLVAQQLLSCVKLAGIDTDLTTELTGKSAPASRAEVWKKKRFFFLTPQVLLNDITSGICDTRRISLAIFDEAHHAIGNSCYCKIVRKIIESKCRLRIVGLSATPGSSKEIVQEVVDNLLIERIEIRSEGSKDVKPYVFDRDIETVLIDSSKYYTEYKNTLREIMKTYLLSLQSNNILTGQTINDLNRFKLIQLQNARFSAMSASSYRNKKGHALGSKGVRRGYEPSKNSDVTHHKHTQLPRTTESSYSVDRVASGICENTIKSNIHTLISLLYALEMLEGYGVNQCLYQLCRFRPKEDGLSFQQRPNTPVCAQYDKRVHDLVTSMEKTISENGSLSHPKINKMCEIVVEFLKTKHEEKKDVRVMIFSQYRKSVEEIYNVLLDSGDIISPAMFLGQSSGFRQKDQLKVLEEFREGIFNVIVSTSVGEEGLDIGQVDMVVFYDIHSSVVRLLQRMGRTSRKRKGRVVLIMSKENDVFRYLSSLRKYRGIQSHIHNQQGKSLNMSTHGCCLKFPGDTKPERVKIAVESDDIFTSDGFSSDDNEPSRSEECENKEGDIDEKKKTASVDMSISISSRLAKYLYNGYCPPIFNPFTTPGKTKPERVVEDNEVSPSVGAGSSSTSERSSTAQEPSLRRLSDHSIIPPSSPLNTENSVEGLHGGHTGISPSMQRTPHSQGPSARVKKRRISTVFSDTTFTKSPCSNMAPNSPMSAGSPVKENTHTEVPGLSGRERDVGTLELREFLDTQAEAPVTRTPSNNCPSSFDDTDLSGFVVPDEDSTGSPSVTQNGAEADIYSRSLLSPSLGGMGIKRGGYKFTREKTTPENLKTGPTQPYNLQVHDKSTDPSMKDFVVSDSSPSKRTCSQDLSDIENTRVTASSAEKSTSVPHGGSRVGTSTMTILDERIQAEIAESYVIDWDTDIELSQES